MKTKHHSILPTPVTQSGDRTQNNPIRPRWFALALGGFLFSSVFALPAPPVEAQCQQWNVGHAWRFKQGPTNVDLGLDQNGTVITGKANHKIYVKQFEGLANVRGTVDGTVKGDSFAVKIYWTNNTIGVYDGTIRPSGKIEGTGYEQRSPSIKVDWYSLGVMKCADAAPVKPKPDATKSSDLNAAADEWLEQERQKRKKARQPTPSAGNGPRGSINGLQMPTPTPSAEADESSSDDQHKKNKKKKKHHNHHDDDQEQGND